MFIFFIMYKKPIQASFLAQAHAAHRIQAYTGTAHGALVIVFGAMHGNEPAGVRALELLFKMLEVEPITKPNFRFQGKLLGLIGNSRAFARQQRFLNKDLNRQWTETTLERIETINFEALSEEEQEIAELCAIIQHEIQTYQPTKVIVLDIHTTSSEGGIFVVPSEAEDSLGLATTLQAPVVKGLLNGLIGTSIQFFNTVRLGVPTIALCFEAGQHDAPLSVNCSIAAIVNCLRAIGCINNKDVETQHDKILRSFSKGLPKVTTFFYRHAIQPNDGFEMLPNFHNFKKIQQGEIIATSKNGNICAPETCRILMPLYQKQGEDGFFLIRE
ncbi:MAG: succinylglutamate desuccinylase/aspartoacylase family protein [Bacteroidota bacterium]|jgi:succinylglutamate desuccinylase